MKVRYLKNLQRVISRDGLIGRWVVEFQCEKDYSNPTGWRTLTFGIYKVLGKVNEGESIVCQRNISGFYRRYRIWFPLERDE
jgi:hypothetical protein